MPTHTTPPCLYVYGAVSFQYLCVYYYFYSDSVCMHSGLGPLALSQCASAVIYFSYLLTPSYIPLTLFPLAHSLLAPFSFTHCPHIHPPSPHSLTSHLLFASTQPLPFTHLSSPHSCSPPFTKPHLLNLSSLTFLLYPTCARGPLLCMACLSSLKSCKVYTLVAEPVFHMTNTLIFSILA